MPSRDSDRLIEIGKIGRPHGVYGAVKAFLHNQDTVLEEGMTIYLGHGREHSTFAVTSIRISNRFFILTLDGVESRGGAEKLCNLQIYLPRSKFPSLDDDEFYVDDIMGLEVWDGETLLGKVKSSRHQGGIEMLQVVCDEFLVDIPLVEQHVEKLDIAGGKLRVKETEHFIKFYHHKRGRQGEES